MYIHSEQDEIVIYHSREKLQMIVVGCLMFILAAVPLAYLGSQQGGGLRLFLLSLSLVSTLCFGASLLYVLKRLRVNTPALIIKADGLYDDATLTGAGYVAWEEIDLLYVGAMNGQRFLCLGPKDMDAFLQRQPLWKRWMMRANITLVGAPIAIPAATLPMPLEELIAQIEGRVLASRRTSLNREVVADGSALSCRELGGLE